MRIFSNIRIVVLAAVLATVLAACGKTINTEIRYDVEGPCEECPRTRLDSLLKLNDGVVEWTIDDEKGFVSIRFDSTAISRRELASLLNRGGYNADMYLGLELTDACCKSLLGDDDVLDNNMPDMEDAKNEVEAENDIANMQDELDAVSDKIEDDLQVGDNNNDQLMNDLENLEDEDEELDKIEKEAKASENKKK